MGGLCYSGVKISSSLIATVESIKIGHYDDCYAASIYSYFFYMLISLPTGRWSRFGCGDTVKRGSGWLAGIGEWLWEAGLQPSDEP